MRLLLDTHTFVWWIRSNPRLSSTARDAISAKGTEIFVSVASAWEISIKVGLGRWPELASLLADFEYAVEAERFHILEISIAHVRSAGLIMSVHRDPFDRLLAAQAKVENCTLVTSDSKIRTLGATCLW